MKRLLVLVVIAVLAFTSISIAAPRRGGTLRVGLNADPPNMDPHQSSAAVDRQVFQSLFDKLVDINQDLEIVPTLATSWTISEGGRVYTFRLRPSVVFHDGTPFNAEAVKYNFERMLDREFGSPRRSEVNLVTRVDVVDNLTVRITLEKAFSPFLAVLSDRAGMMVSPTAARRLGKELAQQPVGAGPYRFVEKRPQERIVLERFDRHWDRNAGNIDRIIYRPFPDENARLANMRAEELDIIDRVPAAEIPRLKTDSKLRYLERSGLEWQGIWLQVQSGVFSNKALRQAFHATIDRPTLVRVVWGESAIPANGPFPPGMFTYSITANSRIPEQNLNLARQKLREGGQPNGFSFTMRTAPGRQNQQVVQVLQAMAAEVGIRVHLEIVEFGALLGQLTSRTFEAVQIGWSGRPDPDGNIYAFFTTGSANNFSGYSNPQVDTLLDAARILTTPEQRRRAYTDVINIVSDDLSLIFLWWPKEHKLVSPKLQGFVHVSDGMMRFRHAWLNP